MVTYRHVNFFETELIELIASGSLTMKVTPSEAVKIGEYELVDDIETRLVLYNGQQEPEIVAVTVNDLSGTLTIVRAKEGTTAKQWPAGTQVISTLTAEVINAALAGVGDITTVGDARYVKLAGSVMTGALTLNGSPGSALIAATKAYVDGLIASMVTTAGFTMAGVINMNSQAITNLPTPVAGSSPATKTYADNANTVLQDQINDSNGILTTGTSTAYVLDTARNTALSDGIRITFRPHVANGAAATLNKDGTGARAIHIVPGTALPEGTLVANVTYTASYSASQSAWVLAGSLDQISNPVPTGAMFNFAGATAPSGYLLCHGQAVSRTTESRLFNVIGTTYGAGDGSTTFNVPDCRGRVSAGKDNMGGSAAGRLTTAKGGVDGGTLGAVGGVEEFTLLATHIPAHDHGAAGTHTHTVPLGSTDGVNQGTGGAKTANIPGGTTTTTESGSHTHTSFGGGNPHPNVQPSIVLNVIIRK
jgi:microcystin-dependent protein